MTMQELEEMTCNTLTVKQVAEFLGKDPQVIRDQAYREPKYLGFPICMAGRSYCIPREGFINWAKGLTPIIGYVTLESKEVNIPLSLKSAFPKILFDRQG